MTEAAAAESRVRIWDLPTRLFHWTLALLVVFSIVTVKVGGNWMHWHTRSGYAILALLVFRIVWGLAGSRYALFANFIVSPRVALRRAREPISARAPALQVGHNPLGGWAVLAILAALAVQGVTGLFAYDDIVTEGPWTKFVSNATSQRLTTVHRYNEKVLYLLVALHLAAIAYYRFAKRDDLLTPMLTGDKSGVRAVPADDGGATRLRGAVLAALAAALVGYLVSI